MDTHEKPLARRTAAEVLEDHVRLREAGRLEEDLERNYDPEVVVLTGQRALHGHDGMRETAALLSRVAAPESFRFRTLMANDRVAFSQWTADGDEATIRDGVDSYLMEEGRICAQTIHYSVVSSPLSMLSRDEPRLPGEATVREV